MAEGASDVDSNSGDPFAGASTTAAAGEPDYYAVLGVDSDASADEIRHAYHRLAKLWHPDRYMGAPPALRVRAERRMRALTAAHDTLGDPARRHDYDRHRGADLAGIEATVSPASPAGDSAITADGVTHRQPTASDGEAPSYVPHAHMPAESRGEFNGAGHFMGTVFAILALSLLTRTLAGATYGTGMYVALGATMVLAGLSLWFYTDDATPARWALRVMAGQAHASTSAHAMSHPQHMTHPAASVDWSGQPTEFEQLVDEALAGVPHEFRPYLDNVVVRVKAEPSEEELASVGLGEGWTLFGLYHGVNLTNQPIGGAGPEEITIFQGPIERRCQDNAKRMRQQVRKTVLHELAHHFGIDHEDMPDWVR